MIAPSALVAGGGLAAAAIAITLGRRGVEVTVVDCGDHGPAGTPFALDRESRAALTLIGVPRSFDPNAAPAEFAEVERQITEVLAEVGAEARPRTRLLGCLDLGTHVEADLSDGRVENFDLVVLVGVDNADPAAPWGSRRVQKLPVTDVWRAGRQIVAAVRWAQVLPTQAD